MLNANLILFQGLQGEAPVQRVVGGVDTALLFSVLMVLFTLGMWLAAILPRKGLSPGTLSEAGLEGRLGPPPKGPPPNSFGG
jgi:hypothetical protein